MSKDSQIVVITIDGESSTGKSALASGIAAELGYHFLNSGALYRLFAYLHMQDETRQVEEIANEIIAHVEIKVVSDAPVVLFKTQDVTHALMQDSVAMMASKLAKQADVRQVLIPLQQSFAQAPGLVAEGRDMGMAIFPNASVKLYFTAPMEVRVRRRYEQLVALGQSVDRDKLSDQMIQRDENDRQREHSPLRIPNGAIEFDTSKGTLLENKQKLVKLIQRQIDKNV